MNIEELLNRIDPANLSIPFGRITNISSTTLIATGLEVAVGDIIKIEYHNRNVVAQVLIIPEHNVSIQESATLYRLIEE